MKFLQGNNRKKVSWLLGVYLVITPLSVYGATPATLAVSDFTYILENRADPFLPFILDESTVAEMNEIVDQEEGPLTGMQLFEPGQLTLVALLQVEDRSVAMVEDFTGKGYVLREGMKIGRRGVVEKIASGTVFIKETAYTRAGDELVNTIEMTLNNEEKKE